MKGITKQKSPSSTIELLVIFMSIRKAGLVILRSGTTQKVLQTSYPKTLKKQHHVTYNSKDRDGVFMLYTTKGAIEFIPHESGLHYLDLKDQHESAVALVMTIRNNFKGYTKWWKGLSETIVSKEC